MRTEVELIGEGHSAESSNSHSLPVQKKKKWELLCKVVKALFLSIKETLKKIGCSCLARSYRWALSPVKSMTPGLVGPEIHFWEMT